MPPSLGVNLRVTGHCNQGGRKYMEDVFSVAYQQTADEKDLEYAFFGIFDGHGGAEASKYAKDHLMDMITKQKGFWSDDDDQVLKAIREGFITTQQAMWKDLPNWRKTASGLPSTAGTTASICFIKRGKLFIGHVGDSGITLAERDPHHPSKWRAKPLTRDHKPDCEIELARIRKAGGKVVAKSGVPRVVWYRPTGGHQGPVRRSTHIEEIPFLAVARALGDLWSYNAKEDVYVVSPDPDLHVFDLNVLKDRCLILGTDGLWNVLSPGMAVQSAFDTERNNEKHMINPECGLTWINPSKKLVDLSIQRWNMCSLRADNVSVVTVMLDPPGPPRAKVLRRLHGVDSPQPKLQQPLIRTRIPTSPEPPPAEVIDNSDQRKSTPSGISIISRFPNSKNESEKEGTNLVASPITSQKNGVTSPNFSTRIFQDSTESKVLKLQVSPSTALRASVVQPKERKIEDVPTSTTPDVRSRNIKPVPVNKRDEPTKSNGIQCSEVTSSDAECDSPAPPPLPLRPLGGHKSNNRVGALRNEHLPMNHGDGAVERERPMTRTRNQSGPQARATVGSQAGALKCSSPPPLPVKQVRRSIVPGYSGYNSDSENQPANASPCTRPLRSTRLATPSATVMKEGQTLKLSHSPASKDVQKLDNMKTPDVNRSPPSRVLRSRNTPANPSRCDPVRSRAPAATPGTGKVLMDATRNLTTTSKKRKSRSFDSNVPTLAAKMLKLGHPKTSGWTNNIMRKTNK